MAREVFVRKTVYDSKKYKEVVNTNFSSFGVDAGEQLPITIQEFFDLYEDLYLNIPLTGENSHTALINRSSELVNAERENAEITLLFQEINDLREQLADSSNRIAELSESSLEAEELRQQVGTLTDRIENIRDVIEGSGGDGKKIEEIERFLNNQGV